MCCNKSYQHKFDRKLKERLFNTYNSSNHDKSKLILLLQMNNMNEKKEFLKIFEIKNLGEHDGLYVQSDALLIADAFEIFRNMPFEIYKFDPEKKKKIQLLA